MSKQSTPLMRQWQAAKTEHPDAVVMIRVGDFYELLGPDAEIGVQVLGLTPTGKGHGAARVPMAGVPARSRDEYAERLVAAGYRVAVAEQMEAAATADGPVRREVVEVLTPGTVLSDALLREGRNRFLAALAGDGDQLALAAVDVSTGEVVIAPAGADSLESELRRLEPAELLVPESWTDAPAGAEGARLTRRPAGGFDPGIAWDEACHRYGVRSLEGLGIRMEDAAVVSALGALFAYLREVRPQGLPHLRAPRLERGGDAMLLDEMTRRNLELVEPLRAEPDARPGEGTLLGVIDETLTPMGARLLRAWLLRPLLSRDRIEARHEAVQAFVEEGELRRRVRAALGRVRDLERLAGKLAAGRIAPREMRQLADSLAHLPTLRQLLAGVETDSLGKLRDTLDPLAELRDAIDLAIAEAPEGFGEGAGVIRTGYDAELDELRQLRNGAADWMSRFQLHERERTGITALKVGYNRVFGYFLEVPSAVAERVPGDYERRQTLANAERYVTPELKEWEERILHADERILEVEQRLFQSLRAELAGQVKRLQDAALRVAMLDVLAGLAECADRRGYTRPRMHEGFALEIRGSRHPVVETMMPGDRYIPNDVVLDEERRVMILTGPNMAGKSTVLRMVGVVQLLAQMGAFVPADSASLGLCDRVYTRVGASDNLMRGQSTFMVEASECATILNSATRSSLVLMDEVGRGTSTYDGVSLAWAITESLAQEVGAKTLFATHYHELIQLAELLPGVVNYSVAAREAGEGIVFLYRLVPGGADRSYGIEVARLAGVPEGVVRRAREILAMLEGARAEEGRGIEHLPPIPAPPPQHLAPVAEAAPAAGAEIEVARRIRALDLDRTTPLDALLLLAELRAALARPAD